MKSSLTVIDKWVARRVYGAAASLLAALVLSSCSGGGGNGDSGSTQTTSVLPPDISDKSVLVQPQPGTDIAAFAQAHGCTVLQSDPETGVYRLSLPPGQSQDDFASQLSSDGQIASAEPDQHLLAPEAPRTSDEGGTVGGYPVHLAFDRKVRFTALFDDVLNDASINEGADKQVDLGTAPAISRGAGVTVAVLDTGIMQAHPDLQSHLIAGYNAVDPSASPEDIADGQTNAAWGHGTMVAGIIVRLAPDARILPVRVMNGDGNGSVLQVVKGINYAVGHGARVLNLSLGSVKSSRLLERAIKQATDAGVIVVAAAGNDGTNTPHYPAALPGVVGVAALESDNTKASYSSYGSYVSLAAPGTGIESTYVNGGFATWSGTSFATPFVSAAAALTLAVLPASGNGSGGGSGPGRARDSGPPPTAVVQRLFTTAASLDSRNPGYAGGLGKGLIDIQRAVTGSP